MSHTDLLRHLLPPASIDPQAPTMGAEIDAEGAALDGAQSTAAALLREADPRSAAAMFTDWERVAGLPDGCVAIGEQTAAQRRAALVARLTQLGGQTPAYFVGLAAALGYTITVTEFKPHTVLSAVNAPIYGTQWRYAWRVNAPAQTVTVFRVNGRVSDPLASWGNTILECVISRLKPAHTHVQFTYGA